ncbi:hypothetical protein BDZ89DRAFT_1063717, partial [Hymenopellis radicata]
MFEYDARLSPNHVLYCYEDPTDGTRRDITWAEAIKAYRVAGFGNLWTTEYVSSYQEGICTVFSGLH